MVRIAALLLVVAFAAACGGSAETRGTTKPPPASATGPGLTISQARESELDGPLLVRGALVVDSNHTRLCEALAESYPPQCAGPSLDVAGLDLDSVDLEREGAVRWADQVKLLGTVANGILMVSPTATG
jgi:hypothetical protein